MLVLEGFWLMIGKSSVHSSHTTFPGKSIPIGGREEWDPFQVCLLDLIATILTESRKNRNHGPNLCNLVRFIHFITHALCLFIRIRANI